MDYEILKQYINLTKEFDEEEKRIRRMEEEIQIMKPAEKKVMDVVTKGKKGRKPLGICFINGTEDYTEINRKRAKLRERKAKQELQLSKIENLILDVEEYVNEIADSETRRIMRYFYIEGKTWNETASVMGEGYTGEACKKKVQRELRKI